MSYIWCHGPYCHNHETKDRVRGSKGSKVLRTRKIKQDTDREWYTPDSIYNYFCSQGCIADFWNVNAQRVIALAPRTEPLETPCEVETETSKDHYGHNYTRTVIRKIDTSR